MKNHQTSSPVVEPLPLNELTARFPLVSNRAASAARLLLGYGRENLVEEIANDVLLRLWRHHLAGKMPQNPEAWAYRVAWNRAARVAKLENRYVTGLVERVDDMEDAEPDCLIMPANDFTPATGLELKERIAAVKKILDAFDMAAQTHLHGRDALLFDLTYRKKLSGDEVAERLGMTPEAFRKQWSRLLAKVLEAARLQLQKDPLCKELLTTVLSNEQSFRHTFLKFLRLAVKKGVEELERLLKLTMEN